MEESGPIGVIGGSGLYRLAAGEEWRTVATPWGEPSDAIALADLGGGPVAFLPRHGRGHAIPAHRINHRANLWALRSLGVERVLGPCAVGSLRSQMAPGDVVVCDQFIDSTGAHETTFFEGPEVAHVSLADPYCEELRPLAIQACAATGFTVHEVGTVVVVRGPRFSTRAESRSFRAQGGDVINMTQFPEVALARELGMCYVNLSLVTDYDSGVEDRPDHAAVSQEKVMEVFARHTARLREALEDLLRRARSPRGCRCRDLRAIPIA